MEYRIHASLDPLPLKVIDTGMGFERLCVAIQGKKSNYDTDVFQPMIHKIEELSGKVYGKESECYDVAIRVIADHIRTIAFAITDGQLPSNAKAGYVIRRILRRAVRYGFSFLGQEQPFLYKLIPQLVSDMGEAYPELVKQQTLIEKVIKEEEYAFYRTLYKGIEMVNSLISSKKDSENKVISGKDVFVLYDTYGFPLDLTKQILGESGMTCNEEEFNDEMLKQKERARNAQKTENGDWVVVREGETEFVGYDNLECDTQILRYRQVRQKDKAYYQLVLSRTPFYAEMGGQVGDTGTIGDVRVSDTKRENNLSVHITTELPEDVEATMIAKVDAARRQKIADNHSATHLLHYALRQVLGTHVEQKGSYVSADSLRFDFSHFQKVTPEELREVEKIANNMVRSDFALAESRHTPIAEARKMGAMALFGEKYGDDVRVIGFGPSVELCGGTHVSSTGRIGHIRIIMETSVAAGVRRIEAVTADAADNLYYMQQDLLQHIRSLFNNTPDLALAVQKFINENTSLKKQVDEFWNEKAQMMCEQFEAKAEPVGNVKLTVFEGEVNPDMLRQIMSLMHGRFTQVRYALVAATVFNNKPMISLFLSQPMVDGGLNASVIIKNAAKHIQGGGGGQPWMATAGGRLLDGLDAAKKELVEIIKNAD